jgi:hypothetical protein
MYSKEKIMQTLVEIKEEAETITPYVIVAQPRRSQESLQAQSLNGQFGVHVDFSGYNRAYIEVTDLPVDSARNYLMEQVLDSNAEYLFFIGDDTVVPWNAFTQLHKTAQENPDSVIIGVYYFKVSSPMIFVKKDNKISVPNVDPGQVFEVWRAGMDCMLIPIRILKEMYEKDPDLPFCCIANEIPGIPFVGEDTFFIHRLRKNGYKVLVDTDVQCLHMDVHTGKYTAHPNVNLNNYFTNIPLAGELTIEDKRRIDEIWVKSMPKIPEVNNEHSRG